MKCKVKRMLCLVCVFVASFVLTVTAFADFIIYNENFIGKYKCNSRLFPDSYVQVMNTGIFKLHAYYDDNRDGLLYYSAFISGSSQDGKISNSPPYNFYAYFENAYLVLRNGDLPTHITYIPDYQAIGDIDVEGKWKKISIISKQSDYSYILNK